MRSGCPPARPGLGLVCAELLCAGRMTPLPEEGEQRPALLAYGQACASLDRS